MIIEIIAGIGIGAGLVGCAWSLAEIVRILINDIKRCKDGRYKIYE